MKPDSPGPAEAGLYLGPAEAGLYVKARRKRSRAGPGSRPAPERVRFARLVEGNQLAIERVAAGNGCQPALRSRLGKARDDDIPRERPPFGEAIGVPGAQRGAEGREFATSDR